MIENKIVYSLGTGGDLECGKRAKFSPNEIVSTYCHDTDTKCRRSNRFGETTFWLDAC